MKRTRVYIDGFNLYHGLIRDNNLHWLDLQAFADHLNRNVPVDAILFCTAMVSGTQNDPDKPLRQDVYHRALAIACAKVEILKGNFTSHNVLKPLACCRKDPVCLVRVSARSEKGSDVNLACRLLFDAHANNYDRAIVVSGDTDLVEPIRLVVHHIGKEVWVRNPRDVPSAELEAVATSYQRIRPQLLQNTQLPDPVTDGVRTYHQPPKWKQARNPKTKRDVMAVSCAVQGCQKIIKTCNFS